MNLVCYGGTGYTDKETIFNELDGLHSTIGIDLLITACLPGACMIAEFWATENNVKTDIVRQPKVNNSLNVMFITMWSKGSEGIVFYLNGSKDEDMFIAEAGKQYKSIIMISKQECQ